MFTLLKEGIGFCFYEPAERTVNLQIISFSIFLFQLLADSHIFEDRSFSF